MALIKNAEFWFTRLVPDRPNKKYDRERPTWEVQVRTYDAKQRKEWEAQGLRLKAVVPDDGTPPYWKTTLKKRTVKADGSTSEPVEVTGGNLRAVDPEIIGNRSRGNVRVYQYEYKLKTGGVGIANVLMAVQLTKLVKYTPKPRDDDFEEQDMEVIEEEDDEEEEGTASGGEFDEEEEADEVEEEEEEEEQEEEKPAPKKKPLSPGKKPTKFD